MGVWVTKRGKQYLKTKNDDFKIQNSFHSDLFIHSKKMVYKPVEFIFLYEKLIYQPVCRQKIRCHQNIIAYAIKCCEQKAYLSFSPIKSKNRKKIAHFLIVYFSKRKYSYAKENQRECRNMKARQKKTQCHEVFFFFVFLFWSNT